MKLIVDYVKKILNQRNVVEDVKKTLGLHIVCRGNRTNEVHCHLTGRFGGSAHCECNLNTRKSHSPFVPILFQNFYGYDSHLFLEILIKMALEKINGEYFIAKSSEKHKSVRTVCLRTLDS